MNQQKVRTMKKTMKTVLTAVAVASIGCGFVCQQAKAAALPEISGDIAFYGSSSASGASAANTTTILGFTDPWNILSATGDYSTAGIAFNSAPVTFTDFSFTGDGSSVSLIGTIKPEWTFTFGGNTYSFDLLSLTNGHTDSGAMSFSGTGIVHATGFADTAASWSLQGAAQEPFLFELSSSTTSSVTEGDVMSLVGLGLVVLAGKGLLGRSEAS
jgi:hypothetical protein